MAVSRITAIAVAVLVAQPAHHLEAVDPGQHQVEHDEIGALAGGGVERLAPVGGDAGRVARRAPGSARRPRRSSARRRRRAPSPGRGRPCADCRSAAARIRAHRRRIHRLFRSAGPARPTGQQPRLRPIRRAAPWPAMRHIRIPLAAVLLTLLVSACGSASSLSTSTQSPAPPRPRRPRRPRLRRPVRPRRHDAEAEAEAPRHTTRQSRTSDGAGDDHAHRATAPPPPPVTTHTTTTPPPPPPTTTHTATTPPPPPPTTTHTARPRRRPTAASAAATVATLHTTTASSARRLHPQGGGGDEPRSTVAGRATATAASIKRSALTSRLSRPRVSCGAR